jgi:hypothetical protein
MRVDHGDGERRAGVSGMCLRSWAGCLGKTVRGEWPLFGGGDDAR